MFRIFTRMFAIQVMRVKKIKETRTLLINLLFTIRCCWFFDVNDCFFFSPGSPASWDSTRDSFSCVLISYSWNKCDGKCHKSHAHTWISCRLTNTKKKWTPQWVLELSVMDIFQYFLFVRVRILCIMWVRYAKFDTIRVSSATVYNVIPIYLLVGNLIRCTLFTVHKTTSGD